MKKALLSVVIGLLLSVLLLSPSAVVFALPDYEEVKLGASDRLQLIALLNSAATDSGKKYVLQSDFVLNASDLLGTYYPGSGRQERSQYATFLSALDGNGKTITINVDRGQSARPLFHNIGSPTGEALTIENLNIRYKGDVKVSAFMSGIARNAVFRNITVEVEGDIVASADYFSVNSDFYAHGFGFRAIDSSFENISLTVGDAFGGGVIGQTTRTIAERLDSEKKDTATYAYGFFSDMRNVTVKKIDIFARLINATGDSGAVAAGFAGSVTAGKDGAIENITISVKDSILARQQADGAAVTTGAYGFARRFDKLKGALITIGILSADNKNISEKAVSRTEAAGFGGVAGDSQAVDVSGNTVRVNGGVFAVSTGLVDVSGGYIGVQTGAEVFKTGDNIVEVIGDIRARAGKLVLSGNDELEAVRVSGFCTGDQGVDSSNDKLYVSGVIRADAEGESNAAVSGFAMTGGDIEGATILLGGISVKAEKGTASASGFSSSFTEGSHHKNNYVRIGGNIDASANGAVNVAGYSVFPLEEGMTVENSCVNITGRINVNSETIEELAVSASGFMHSVTGGALLRNTAVISGNIEVGGLKAESVEVRAAAFLGEALSGSVTNNATLFTGVISIDANLKGSVVKSNFIALLANASVQGNAVFGPAGLEKAPKDFFISAVASVPSFNVTDNVYVAMLGEERVSHPLNFTVVNGKSIVAPRELAKPLPSLSTTKKTAAEFTLSDKQEGALSVFGLTRRDAVIIGSGSSISITRKSLMGSSDTLLPYVTVYSRNGGSIIIRDILGAEPKQPKTISGVIFYDNNNNGRFDTGDTYQPSVLFDVVVRGGITKTVATDRAGKYSFTPPLVSAMSEEYRLVIQMPATYAASAHSVNKFRDGTAVLPDIQYDKVYDSVNGALTAPRRYSVEFIVSGGSLIKAQSVFEGSKAEKPDEPSREGYVFEGWYVDSAFSKQYEFQNPVFENLKLHAKWVELPKALAFTLSYDGNGSTSGKVPEALELSVGDVVEIEARVPVRNGYTFDGWQSDYNEAVYRPGDSFRMPSADVSLSAIWSEILATYTVSFMSEGGSEVKSITGVAHGGTVPEPEAPTRLSYLFEGWYSDAGYLSKWNFAKDTVQGDMALYARWDFKGAVTIGAGKEQSIVDKAIPLSGIQTGKWGLSNLVFALSCVALSLFMVINAVKGFPTRERSRSLMKILISFFGVAVALGSGIFFLATTEFSKGAAIVDRWSWVLVLLAAAEVIFLMLFRNPEREEW